MPKAVFFHKRSLLIFSAVFCLLLAPFLSKGQTGEILRNSDIIKLTKLDLSPSVVVSKIRKSRSNFDVSIDALVILKTEGVNAEVINEMINVSPAEHNEVPEQKHYTEPKAPPATNYAEEAPPAPVNYNDPKTMRKAGVYYYNRSNPNKLFIPIDPTVVSGSKSGGFGTAVAQNYTYG